MPDPDKRTTQQPEDTSSEGLLDKAHRYYDQAAHLVEEKYDEMKRWLTSDEEDELDEEEELKQRQKRTTKGRKKGESQQQGKRVEDVDEDDVPKAEKEVIKSGSAHERQEQQKEELPPQKLPSQDQEKTLYEEQLERQDIGQEEEYAEPPQEQVLQESAEFKPATSTTWHSEPERKAIEKQEAAAKERSQFVGTEEPHQRAPPPPQQQQQEGEAKEESRLRQQQRVNKEDMQRELLQTYKHNTEEPPTGDVEGTTEMAPGTGTGRPSLKENSPESTTDTFSHLTGRTPEKKQQDFEQHKAERERHVSIEAKPSRLQPDEERHGEREKKKHQQLAQQQPAHEQHKEFEKNPATRFEDIGPKVEENVEQAKKDTEKHTKEIHNKLDDETRQAKGAKPEIAQDTYSRLTNRTKEQKRHDLAQGEQREHHKLWRSKHAGGGRHPRGKTKLTPTATVDQSTMTEPHGVYPRENDPHATTDTYSRLTGRSNYQKQKSMGIKQGREQRSQGSAEVLHPELLPQAAQHPAKKSEHHHKKKHDWRQKRESPTQEPEQMPEGTSQHASALHHEDIQQAKGREEPKPRSKSEWQGYLQDQHHQQERERSQRHLQEQEQPQAQRPHHEHEWYSHGIARQSLPPDHVLQVEWAPTTTETDTRSGRPLQQDQRQKEHEKSFGGRDRRPVERQLRKDQEHMRQQHDKQLQTELGQHDSGESQWSSQDYKQWKPRTARPLQEQQQQLYKTEHASWKDPQHEWRHSLEHTESPGSKEQDEENQPHFEVQTPREIHNKQFGPHALHKHHALQKVAPVSHPLPEHDQPHHQHSPREKSGHSWVHTPLQSHQQQTKEVAEQAGQSAREVEKQIKGSMRDEAKAQQETQEKEEGRDLPKSQRYKRVSEHSWLVAQKPHPHHPAGQ